MRLFLKANSSLIFGNLYREHCYSNSSRNKNHKSETNYYNYGSVGFQGEINGTISINPSKRALEETEEDRAELSKTHQNCHSGK